MKLNQINEQILEQINKFQTVKELEDYLNTEQFKNLAIELKIENIKLRYKDKKEQKKYIKNIQENILNINKNISFTLKDFNLIKRKNTHFSSQVLSNQEALKEIPTYIGTIHIKTEPSYNNILMSPSGLFEDTIFNTGNGGGGLIAKYEFYFLEKHMPNLALHFLFDCEKNNSLLNYREECNILDSQFSELSNLFKIKIQNQENKESLLNRINGIFDTHFLNGSEKEVNLIQNVIDVYSKIFIESQPKEKYLSYLQRVYEYLKEEKNLEKIIKFNLPNNKVMEQQNTNKIKENVKTLIKNIQLELFKFGNEDTRVEFYECILNLGFDKNKNKIQITKSEAIKDVRFIKYCFNENNEIPKFFTLFVCKAPSFRSVI